MVTSITQIICIVGFLLWHVASRRVLVCQKVKTGNTDFGLKPVKTTGYMLKLVAQKYTSAVQEL